MINERFPFYFITTSFLFITIVLSLASTFTSTKNLNDYFPNKFVKNGKEYHDGSYVEKLCWYFSQITHHTLFLLFAYFFMALINRKSEMYFKMVAPLAMTISVLYFYFLYPRQSLSVHQLPFYSFFSHFMIIFLVFGEFIYINKYEFKETTYCLLFITTSLLAIYINYTLRGVWSYNLVKLDRYSGWKLVSTAILIMYMFSVMFYFLKYKNHKYYGINFKKMKNGILFFSGIINIIFFLLFDYYENKDVTPATLHHGIANIINF